MNHFTHSGSLHEEPSIREIAHAKLARRAAAEGIVLLKMRVYFHWLSLHQ